MDNMGNSHLAGSSDIDKPIPFDDGLDKKPPLSSPPPTGSPGVSRAPLNLGGSSGTAAPTPVPTSRPTPVPTPRPAAKTPTPAPVSRPPVGQSASSDRISGVKTFFTKLHPGAMEFLDDLVNTWLQENPDIHVKYTNITTGEVQAKKTEPNLIICLWY